MKVVAEKVEILQVEKFTYMDSMLKQSDIEVQLSI